MTGSASASSRWRRRQLVAVGLILLAGGVAAAVGLRTPAAGLLIAATLVAMVPATLAGVRGLVAREPGVDLIAVLAMAGALLLGEYLAGAIIALMLTGGEALEAHAAGRARRELTGLLSRVPRQARLCDRDGSYREVALAEVAPGDRIQVRQGEVVPTDGVLLTDRAVLDQAALTGEARPVEVTAGELVLSGVVNAAAPLELRATVAAERSTYAGIVRLVERAATERAPFVRLADRYATMFVAVTLALAAGAWLWSGDPVRALAVLVVATPCPLILAAPAAIVGGISRAARDGIIVKGGAAIESLGVGRVVLLDKTGTITTGKPTVASVTPLAGLAPQQILRFAASLEQMSLHPYAPAIVSAATQQGGELADPATAEETLGLGITGRVDGHEVAVGQLGLVAPGVPRTGRLERLRRRAELEGAALVYVGLDGGLVGALTLIDPIRADAAQSLTELRRAGIDRVLMVSGDRAELAELVGETLGIDRVLAQRSPEEKVDAVREAQALGPTIMVGDGINDAPALAMADTGVAMGARGATAASEAADVVLTRDRLDGLAQAVRIARRTRRIAWQSVVTGMGLSMVAMGFAAAGYLTPVAGALLQEGIDVAVILNALRALRGPNGRIRRASVHDRRGRFTAKRRQSAVSVVSPP